MPISVQACALVVFFFPFSIAGAVLAWCWSSVSLSPVGVLVDSFVSRNEESTFGSSC